MTVANLTEAVAHELVKLGAKATFNPNAGPDRDVALIECDGFTIRAYVIGYGAKKGRIDWNGYAPNYPELHYSYRPKLGEFGSAGDANPKTIAKRALSLIVEPAKEPLAVYKTRLDAYNAEKAALPAAADRLRLAGATVHLPGDMRGATTDQTRGALYYTKNGASMSGDVQSDGRISNLRGSLTARQLIAVIELLEKMGEE